MPANTDVLGIAFTWLDNVFYGVEQSADFVLVPLPPDTPVQVFVAASQFAGSLFDLRAKFVDDVPLTPELYEFVAQNADLVSEGYVRVVPHSDGRGHLEVRYQISVTSLTVTPQMGRHCRNTAYG